MSETLKSYCEESNPMAGPTDGVSPACILIIDDDEDFCSVLHDLVQHLGHHAHKAHSLKEGLRRAMDRSFDLVLLDVNLPDGSGLDILQDIKRAPSLPEVIIITGKGEVDGAEFAIRGGAWDYIEKPSSMKEIALPLIRALQHRAEKHKNAPVALKIKGIVGNSPLFKERINGIVQAARSETNVLITGETGTGKELFARAIHENSDRAEENFTIVDCGAMPENLVESMLFGHEKGAFTGASTRQPGLLLQADGGTLFLDEVGELPLNLQKAFLRAIQERRFRPIGSKREVNSDFRLVAATNRSLDHMVEKGLFRGDLLFRLRGFSLDLPPLRRRHEDILDLTLYHMGHVCKRASTGIKGFSPDLLEALYDYDWPGNVRELFQSLEMALAVAGEAPTLFPHHLPDHIRIKLRQRMIRQNTDSRDLDDVPTSGEKLSSLRDYREELIADGEKRYLLDLMHVTRGDVKEACRISRLSRSRLYDLMKKYGISRPR